MKLTDIFGVNENEKFYIKSKEYGIYFIKNNTLYTFAYGREFYNRSGMSINSLSNIDQKDIVVIKSKPKLTEQEKLFLRSIPNEYKYLVKTKKGSLNASVEKPVRISDKIGWAVFIGKTMYFGDYLKDSTFISFDDEPVLIEDLLKED